MLKNVKQFVLAGNAYFTVSNPAGQHFTYRVSKPDDNPSSAILDFYFVSVLTGPDNTKNYTYAGMLDGRDNFWLPNKTFRATKNSKIKPEALSWKVFEWAMKLVYANQPFPPGYTLKHANRCGRCGRMLTDPESITDGIGPECRKHMGIQ